MSIAPDDLKPGMLVIVRYTRCDPRCEEWDVNYDGHQIYEVKAVSLPFAAFEHVSNGRRYLGDLSRMDLEHVRPELAAAMHPSKIDARKPRPRVGLRDEEHFDHPDYGKQILFRGRLL